MGCTRPHLRWASGLVGQESASERPASARCNDRHSVLPRHGVCPLCTSNIMGLWPPTKSRRNNPIFSPDGGGYRTCPIRPQQPIVRHRGLNNEGSKPILSLSWIAQDMKRTSSRHPYCTGVPGRQSRAGRTALSVQALPIAK